MKMIINRGLKWLMPAIAMVGLLASCNKDLPEAEPIVPPVSSGSTIAEELNKPEFSLLKFAVGRAGLTTQLANKSAEFTFFAPDNAAFQASGFADTNAIKALPGAQWNAILSYGLIGGQKISMANIPAGSFPPNLYLPSTLVIAPPSATLPTGLRMPIFPGKQGTFFYANNIPLGQTDIAVANGVIHKTLGIVAPPTGVLKTVIGNVPDLSYFRAAIARADSGQVGLNRFDSLLNYAATNMTILAPNDLAFQILIYGLVYGQVLALTGDPAVALAQASAAVVAGPAFLSTNNVTTEQIRGIMAYHFLASNPKGAYEPNYRAFSVSFGSTPFFVKTLVNSAISVHPGISVQATYTGPVVSSLTFSSYGSFPPGGTAFSYTANAVSMDRNAVNGVFHIIDKVLLPQ